MIKPLYEYLLKKKKFNLMLFLNEEQLNVIMQNKSISPHEKLPILLRNKKIKPLKLNSDNLEEAKEYIDAFIERIKDKHLFLKRRILKFYQQIFPKQKSKKVEARKEKLYSSLILHLIYSKKYKEYKSKPGKINRKIRNYCIAKQTEYIVEINDLLIHKPVQAIKFIKNNSILRELFLRFLKENDSPSHLKMFLTTAPGLLEIPEVKDYILSEHILSSRLFGYIYELYEDLPKEKKTLLAYYRGNKYNILKLLKNNLDGYFLLDEQETIANILNIIENDERRKHFFELVIKDTVYITKIQFLSEYGFENNISATLKFLYKYKENNIHEEILNANKDTIILLKEKLAFLNTVGALLGLDTLDELKEASLEELKTRPYDIKKLTANRKLNTPPSDKKLGFFKYPIEVLIIPPNGEIEELPVTRQNPRHHLALMGRFPKIIEGQVVNIYPVAAAVNRKLNTIVFGIENNGISMFFPASITSKQKDLAIGILTDLQNFISSNELFLFGGITKDESGMNQCNEGTYLFNGMYLFNEGNTISIERAIEEIGRIPLDENLAIQYTSKYKSRRIRKKRS